jgi:hypothetical protein
VAYFAVSDEASWRPRVPRAPPDVSAYICMSRPARTSLTGASSEALARWGAAAACLGAISYGASGYLDNPDASGFVIGFALPVLEVATSASFLGGLLALYFWAGEGGLLRRAGFLMGSVGTMLGLLDALNWWEADRWIVLYVTLTLVYLGILVGLYFWPGRDSGSLRRIALPVGLVGTVLGLFDGLDWWEPDWWILLFFALTAVGLDMIFVEAPRVLGVLVLASGALGWVSLLTDPAFSGVLVPTRPVHVAFAALFCLSCIAWGMVLFRKAS